MSDVILKLGTDTSQMKSGLNEAKGLLRDLDQQANKKGIFEKLNNDVKNFGNTFGTIKDQIGSGNFIGALATASKAGASMAGGMSTLIPVLGGVGLAAGAVGASVVGMWKAMSKADDIGDTAEQSGLLVSELMVLEKSFSRVGIESEQVPAIMTHVRDALATLNDPASAASKAFEKIGLSAASFEGKSYYEAMKLIGDALGNAKNKTDALTAATVAFGTKKGTKVGQALGETDFAKAESNVPASAAIIQEQGAQFEKFQIAIMRLKPSLDNFFLGMASEVVPELESGAQQIESSANALVEAGKTFGTIIASAVGLLTSVAGGIKSLFDSIPSWVKSPTGQNTTQAQGSAFMGGALTKAQNEIAGTQTTTEPLGPPASLAPKKTSGFGVDLGIAKSSTEKMEPITASLTKVGGGQSGMWTDSLGVQREQLNVLRQISQGIARWGQTFKPDANPMIGINGGDVASIA